MGPTSRLDQFWHSRSSLWLYSCFWVFRAELQPFFLVVFPPPIILESPMTGSYCLSLSWWQSSPYLYLHLTRAHPYKQGTEEGRWSERGPEGGSPPLLAALAPRCRQWHGYPSVSRDCGDCTGERGRHLRSLEERRSCQLSYAGDGGALPGHVQ